MIAEFAVMATAVAAAAVRTPHVVTNTYENGEKVLVNYDESRIAPYTLEDPLTFTDGRKVATLADWRERRAELLDVFAKEMGITVRYVGTEPLDPVTARYNEIMKETLPVKGIEVVEVPRLTVNGEIVSATKVREKLIKEST